MCQFDVLAISAMDGPGIWFSVLQKNQKPVTKNTQALYSGQKVCLRSGTNSCLVSSCRGEDLQTNNKNNVHSELTHSDCILHCCWDVKGWKINISLAHILVCAAFLNRHFCWVCLKCNFNYIITLLPFIHNCFKLERNFSCLHFLWNRQIATKKPCLFEYFFQQHFFLFLPERKLFTFCE